MAKVAGSIWVEGNNLHFVDQFNREWYMPGIFQKSASAKPGSLWIDPNNQFLYFINEAGNTVMYPYPYGDALLPIGARMGSLWVGQDNQLHWAGIPWPGPPANTYRYNVRAHNDVAATSGHSDAHQDAIHGDSHTDGAHSDIHSDYVHDDGHTDIQHGDTPAGSNHDDAHSDFPGAQFNDHLDANPYGHYDNNANPKYNLHMDTAWIPTGVHVDFTDYNTQATYPHGDQTNHTDVPHEDYHGDYHGDTPHSDIEGKNQHGDFWDGVAHSDIPHSDVPHVDAAHVDAHQDSHIDTPHTDEPILIGP